MEEWDAHSHCTYLTVEYFCVLPPIWELLREMRTNSLIKYSFENTSSHISHVRFFFGLVLMFNVSFLFFLSLSLSWLLFHTSSSARIRSLQDSFYFAEGVNKETERIIHFCYVTLFRNHDRIELHHHLTEFQFLVLNHIILYSIWKCIDKTTAATTIKLEIYIWKYMEKAAAEAWEQTIVPSNIVCVCV